MNNSTQVQEKVNNDSNLTKYKGQVWRVNELSQAMFMFPTDHFQTLEALEAAGSDDLTNACQSLVEGLSIPRNVIQSVSGYIRNRCQADTHQLKIYFMFTELKRIYGVDPVEPNELEAELVAMSEHVQLKGEVGPMISNPVESDFREKYVPPRFLTEIER